MIKPTPEQFEEWRSGPVAEWFFDTFLKAEMKRTRETFEAAAWEGHMLPITHAAHRERYDTLDWLRSIDAESMKHALESQGE